MIHQFEITCKECGAEGFFDPDNNGVVKMLFEKGTPATMDRVIIYCSKCGGKQEAGICWPLDTDAILTSAMHSDGLYRCPTCNNKILKLGHCYNPHCPDRRR